MNHSQVEDTTAQAMDLTAEWIQIQKQAKEFTSEPDLAHLFYARVTAYFRQHLEQAGGMLNEEILCDADVLYDTPGISATLANALGLSVYDLRVALGKRYQKACQQCGRPMSFIELRKKGGYQKDHWLRSPFCPTCRRKQHRANREERRAEANAEREAAARRRAVDAEILAAEDPLLIKAFRDALSLYANFWSNGKAYQMGWGDIIPFLPGCMLCGQPQKPLRILLARESALPRQSAFWQYIEQLGWHGSGQDAPDDPPLSKIAQAIWRLEPETFFTLAPHYPLFQYPLLLLCDRCAPSAPDTYLRVLL